MKDGGYSVSQVKYHRGHEGMQGVNGTLLRDGQRVATFYDDARGGEWEIRFESGREEERRFLDFVKGLPPTPFEGGEPLQTTPDLFLSGLVERFEDTSGHEAWLRKRCSTQTLFLAKGEKDGREARYRVVRRPFCEEVKKHLEAKYPGCTIINERFPQTAAEARFASANVKVGDYIQWGEEKQRVQGTVVRINAKTLTVRDEQGGSWRCPIGGKIEKVPRPGAGAAGAVKLREVAVNLRDGSTTSRVGVALTADALATLERSWAHGEETVALAGQVVEALVLKDEGGEDMLLGPLTARAGKERIPVVRKKDGTVKWFLASEARKIAHAIGVPLELE